MRTWTVLIGVAALLAPCRPGVATDFDAWLDHLGTHLGVSSNDGKYRARLSGTLDLEYFTFNRPPPGLLDTEGTSLLVPRVALFLDLQAGSAWYAFGQARLDQGFDPGDRNLDARLDEYALRYTPWSDGRLNMQVGKFATVAGQWVKRHTSWQNPFVSAPIFYEQVTRLTDRFVITGRFPVLDPGSNRFYAYNPLIWGPSYAAGAALSGRWSQFEWAVEAKNAALTSRPSYWNLDGVGYGAPTFTGRLAWRPNLAWTFGLSASDGPYLGPDAAASLGGGVIANSFHQSLVLGDASFEWRHWQIWGEWIFAQFEVPFDTTVHTTAYFLEARYKFTPRFSAAVRWNEQSFAPVRRPGRPPDEWGEDQWRIDWAGTWRFNAHSQIQVEVDWRHGGAQLDGAGLNYAARVTVRF